MCKPNVLGASCLLARTWAEAGRMRMPNEKKISQSTLGYAVMVVGGRANEWCWANLCNYGHCVANTCLRPNLQSKTSKTVIAPDFLTDC